MKKSFACSGRVFFLILGEEWPDKVNRLRNWMGDSAEINIVTALDETACE